MKKQQPYPFWRNKVMFIWIDLILMVCTAGFACVGIRQWKQSKKSGQKSLDVFTDRRNAVSCFCLALLCVMVGLCINL